MLLYTYDVPSLYLYIHVSLALWSCEFIFLYLGGTVYYAWCGCAIFQAYLCIAATITILGSNLVLNKLILRENVVSQCAESVWGSLLLLRYIWPYHKLGVYRYRSDPQADTTRFNLVHWREQHTDSISLHIPANISWTRKYPSALPAASNGTIARSVMAKLKTIGWLRLRRWPSPAKNARRHSGRTCRNTMRVTSTARIAIIIMWAVLSLPLLSHD